MKNEKIVELYNALKSVGHLKGVKFGYTVARNLRIITPVIDDLQKSLEPTEKYNKYDEARAKLAEKHADKDENGKAIIKNNTYTVTENKKIFEKEINALQVEHAEAFKEREQQIEDYKKLLQEETKLDLFKVKFSELPNEITANEIDALFEIIEE